MTGPEPYPQVKWTREQEAAYAEGRKSAQGSSQGRSSPSKTSSGKKRFVRTAAGSSRYHVPIGSQIGTARNAAGAKAQKDTESTGRYGDLVGTDAKAQAAAMQGLSNDQVQRLARVAYSFKSSDPNVVRLRLGVAAELKRRGFNVNDFGGLGGGSTRPAGPARAKVPVRKVPAKKVAPAPPVKKAYSAMNARVNDRKLREMSVPQLRHALGVFSRISPDRRQSVARFLVKRAIELSAPNLLGRSVIEAANLGADTQAQVIELAGKWKHGYIPLDATALRIKMKGGNGKPWWEGGKRKRNTSSSTSRRTMEGARIARERKAARKAGAEAPATQGKPRPFVAVPKSSAPDRIPTDTKGVEFRKKSGGTYTKTVRGKESQHVLDQGFTPSSVQQTRRARASLGQKRVAPHHTQTKGDYAFKKRVANERTNVVKSSPKPERGSKVESKRDELNRISSKPIGQRTMSDYNRMAELRKELQDPPLQHSLPSGKLHNRPTEAPRIDSRHEGATMSDREFAKLQMDRDAAPRGAEKARLTKRVNDELARRKGTPPAANADVPQHVKMAGDRKLTQLIRTNSPNAEHAKTELDSRKAHRAKQAQPSGMGGQNTSEKYIEMHGLLAARERLAKLQAKKTKTNMDKVNLSALRAAIAKAEAGKA